MTEKDIEHQLDSQSGNPKEYRNDRWGEDSEESSVNIERAEEEFEVVRRELTHTSTGPGNRVTLSMSRSRQPLDDEEKGQVSSGDSEATINQEDTIDLADFLKRNNEQEEASGIARKKVGVAFRDLNVTGTAGGKMFVQTFKDELVDLFGGFIYKSFKGLLPSGPANPKAIIQGFSGVVKPGEMLLVLGKPGSGSSTFLRALTNQQRPFTKIGGQVDYSGIPFETAKGRYRGEIMFNDEDDKHFATLNTEQTLRFALRMKTPSTRIPGTSRDAFVETLLNLYASIFGMKHTLKTQVGNAFVRGVSGGERKRISIMEALASRATINAYDNSTRGLDSSTAVDYIRSLRIMTSLTESTTIVTLYQAGENIYKEFDKVCLIDGGRQIYYGPANEARKYFEDLGFAPQPRSTTADFLTSITNEKERRTAHDRSDVPKNTAELEAAYRNSMYYKRVQDELADYDHSIKETGGENAKIFEKAVSDQKSSGTREKSPYVVNLWSQVYNLTQRELQLKFQDLTNLKTKTANAVIVALLLGALFYNIPQDSNGAFVTGGACFFSVVVIAWLQFGEGINMLMNRDIVMKQVNFAFYRPSALLIAQMLADIPVMTVGVVALNIIVYFMVNFKREAGAFFIHLLFSWITALCITTWYRAVSAWSPDLNIYVRYAFLGLNIFAFFGGYMQSRLKMQDWYRWVSYLSPVAYAQEAVLTNQYSGRLLPCAPGQIIPAIAGASIENQVCNIPGSAPGEMMFDPSAYALLQFGFTSANTWRNFGIIIAFFAFFLAVALAGVEYAQAVAGGGGLTKQYIRVHSWPFGKKKQNKDALPTVQDIHDTPLKKVVTKSNPSVFTFKNVNYSVGDKQLLHNVEGIVKPGVLLALMGASGAGKTTLLDNLSQRKRTGVSVADLKIDGKGLEVDFERSTGYVEQMDVHDDTATVREALQFSARLRQPKTIPEEDKLAFVEKVMALLELEPLANVLIGGLNIEERKRVTIAVELSARPDTLLFLDEPTSGLDSNGALSIVRFLRKLAQESGLCIVCTIHQPSALLFQNFDEILLLMSGGRTAYSGPIGQDGDTVLNYFADNGAKPAEMDANPAEYILETVRPGGNINWSDIWQSSPQRQALVDEIDHVNAELGALPAPEHLARPLTYAMPLSDQIVEVTKRTWRNYWRDSSYQYSKVHSNLCLGLITGILFFNAKNSILEMQSRGFATFIAVITGATMLTAVQPKLLMLRMYYETRERNSKIYSAPAFLIAMMICEIPYAFFSTIFFFFPYYYMVGFPTSSSVAGYQFFFLFMYEIFCTHCGMIIAGVCPNFDIITVVNPFFFSVTFSFTGILVPWPQLPGIFREFVYYVNPMAYVSRGTIGNVIHGVEVVCAPQELVIFQPPSGQTCAQYAGDWLASTFGYFVDENATADCQYCQFSTGDEYLRSVNINFDNRWNYFGYFIIFIFTNFFILLGAYALFRDIRWEKLWAKHNLPKINLKFWQKAGKAQGN